MTFPTVRSARPAYPPPVPGFNADVGGRDSVEHTFRTQHAVHQQNTDWRAAHSPDIDPQILKDNAGAYQISDAALALAPALDAMKADADAAQAKADALVWGQKVDPTDVAAQLVAQAFWNRKKPVLDSSSPAKAADAARQMISNADPAEIPVLARELPDYFLSRNVPTDWLTSALASRVPGADEAQRQATLLAKHHAVLAQNDSNLRNAFAKDLNPPQLLDPYSPLVTADTYTNGEPYDPRTGGAAASGE
jgi:hypothetical protein